MLRSDECKHDIGSIEKAVHQLELDNPCLSRNLEADKESASPTRKVCFLCREKDRPDVECKVCENITTYYTKTEEASTKEDQVSNVSFPGPGIVKRSSIYGNYVVASRSINAGELIIQERPITCGPYSPPDILPLCLSCCKDIGLSSKCSKCKWPVCGEDCEKFSMHADNECGIFARCSLKPKGLLNEYFSVEVMRALLLRDRNPLAWQRILQFEPHIDARSNDSRAKATTQFVISYIQDKCNLSNVFSSETIDHVVGILSINTFWAFKDLNRYASCLFDKITLMAHDCDPNTDRKLVFLDEDNNLSSLEDVSKTAGRGAGNMALRVTAKRNIMPGEMLTVRYINLDKPVEKRREELKETFYFDCTCSRCLTEIAHAEEEQLIELKLQETSLYA